MGTTVDWNRWLPPRKIRDWGFIELKVGQVWAWRDDFGSMVFRVTKEHPDQDAFNAESLASNGLPDHMDTRHVYGVLVQDVGAPAPMQPDELWQETYALAPDLCYAPGGCAKIRVMGRDEHGKAYCWKHRALWGTVTREVEDDRSIKTMFESIRKSADDIMMGVFREAGVLNDRPAPRRLTPGDQIWLSADGLIRAPCDGRPDCKCERVMAGCAMAKKGDDVVWVSAASGARGLMAFKLAAPHEWNLSALADHSTDTDFFGNPKAGTFSNVLAPMKPLTADSILEAMKTIDAIKPRDAETKKRYDDLVMSGLKTHMDKPIMPEPYYWRPFLDAPAAKPKLTEAEITRLQWAADDGGRYEPELFPDMPEFSVPRTQSQSIAAGLGVWSTRGDAKLPPDPKPYPNVSDEDLLKDA